MQRFWRKGCSLSMGATQIKRNQFACGFGLRRRFLVVIPAHQPTENWKESHFPGVYAEGTALIDLQCNPHRADESVEIDWRRAAFPRQVQLPAA